VKGIAAKDPQSSEGPCRPSLPKSMNINPSKG